ncbi:co-chaperone GroES [Clostridium sp. YIM B02555]|uniref:co-chaperone GroES n=1 Tax=Clostridium sp. YIM B02555 TaxID=2911968 RepID=UPI001EEF723F|nr:co-chaperone GroES [Clostridium sp. YIM B02555]
MKVFGARCIVKEEKQGEETVSGIIIPGKDKEPTYVGSVIAVGDGALLENGERVAMQVKEGDRIAYTTFSGSPIKNGDDEFIILNERDILCVLED